jgi:hypothetical protein
MRDLFALGVDDITQLRGLRGAFVWDCLNERIDDWLGDPADVDEPLVRGSPYQGSHKLIVRRPGMLS